MDLRFHPIRLDGNLDIGRYPEFRSAFERVPAELPVLVDISDATGVDSVFRVFEITGIDAKLAAFENADEALSALGSGAPG